jgi:hypothetical protein
VFYIHTLVYKNQFNQISLFQTQILWVSFKHVKGELTGKGRSLGML